MKKIGILLWNVRTYPRNSKTLLLNFTVAAEANESLERLMNIDCPDSHDFPFLEVDGLRVSK